MLMERPPNWGAIKAMLYFYYWRVRTFLKYGTFDFFRIVQVENTTACNRRCWYCPNSVYDRGLKKNERKMKMSTIKKVIDELAEIGFDGRFSPIFYGEPMLDKRMPSIMAYARKKLPKARLIAYSNGDPLTPELYKKLVDAGTDSIRVTLHGKEIPEGVKKILEENKKNILCIIRGSTMPLNNRGGLLDIDKKSGEPSSRVTKCFGPTDMLSFDYAGNAMLCCSDYFSTITFGNVEKERLLDIWNKPEYRKARKECAEGKMQFEICKKCKSVYETNSPRSC